MSAHVHGDDQSPCDDARAIAEIALEAQMESAPDAIELIRDMAWSDTLGQEAIDYLEGKAE